MRQFVVDVLVIVHPERHLLELIGTRTSPSCLTGHLHGRQQQTDEDTNDSDDNKQFDQGKTGRLPSMKA